MARNKSSKKNCSDIGLYMVCEEGELEPAQLAYYSNAEKEMVEFQSKINMYMRKMNAEIIEKGENCLALQINVTPPAVMGGAQAQKQGKQSTTGILTTRSTSGSPTTTSPSGTFLLMDSRLGLVVSQASATPAASPASVPAKPAAPRRGRPVTPAIPPVTRTRSGFKTNKPLAPPSPTPLPSSTTSRSSDKKTYGSEPSPPLDPSTNTIKVKLSCKQPTESTVRGGLATGKQAQKYMPDELMKSKGNVADSREVTFNKLSGKTFPSLVVLARPHLKLKDIPQQNVTKERAALDAKVKGVLMYSQSKFTEWLIQQGLIRSEQTCLAHCANNGRPVKLKLGMYSDVTRFPHSGGYVWISECCPSQFVSVYAGSIFEGAPHPPSTLLKLIYHWACQTNVQNVVQWVKVSNWYVKHFFTNMRAMCTLTVNEKYQKLGGPKKKVEVGVISLGTTSQDGHNRQVKVEVLGVMDPDSKLLRLRAIEPLPDEKNVKRKFVKILEPLSEWVHLDSTILTDYTVDKGTLKAMGFNNVYQESASAPLGKHSNENVMEYLRRIVPRMFQNTLSLLSRQIIQQFLDELVWREMWGPTASQAFENIVSNLAEQTKLDSSETLLTRLTGISSNPFKIWKYLQYGAQPAPSTSPTPDVVEEVAVTASTSAIRSRKRLLESNTSAEPSKKQVKVVGKKDEKDESVVKQDLTVLRASGKVISDDILAYYETAKQISLNSYYYGSKNGDPNVLQDEYKGTFYAKCPVCNRKFHDAILLMKHILLHCQQEPVIISDVNKAFQCNNCLVGFNQSGMLKCHMEDIHFTKSKQSPICVICEEKFRDKNELVYHMHSFHVELELPYECGVCHMRSSSYKVLLSHFIEVHYGGEHVMCPYCLKVVALAHHGLQIPGNIHFYLSHIEKHHLKSHVKRCTHCRLSFINKGIWEQHLESDHCSFSGDKDVVAFSTGADPVQIPEPGPLVSRQPFNKKLKPSRYKSHHFTFKQLHLDNFEVHENDCCIECEGYITSDHFNGGFNCSKCQFTTFCEKAMYEHFHIFHSGKQQHYNIGKPVPLDKLLHCPCGFMSMSGNRLAKHLARCDYKTVYTNEEVARIVYEKSVKEDKSCVVGEPQNMLNMLGLMRKSSETVDHRKTDKSDEQNLLKQEVDKKDVEMKIEETVD